ncbi:MAG: HD-GYP domain-containing protein [Vulcanimicrobiota bacterium]
MIDVEAKKKIDSLTLLCTRGQELTSVNDLDTLLDNILATAAEITDSVSSSVMLFDKEKNELYFKAVAGEKSYQLKKIRFPADRGIAGYIVKTRENVIIEDVSQDPRHFKGVDEQIEFETRTLAGVPIIWENDVLGVIEAINKKNDNNFTQQDIEYLTILANQAGASIYITNMLETLQNFFVNMLEILMMATETFGGNHGHAVKVARLATKIAREIGATEKEYRELYYSALIHDLGRIRIAKDQIVGGERLIPKLGGEMLRPIKMLKNISKIIEAHHERWDGSGYPGNLMGEEIPLPARILAFAEAFEEFREEGAYRRHFDPYYQDEFFKKEVKSHDPRIVKAFKNLRKKKIESSAKRYTQLLPDNEENVEILSQM